MTGTTYFCTDSHGNTYSRHSARHLVAQYTDAVVIRVEGTTHAVAKSDVQYSSRHALAVANARKYHDGFKSYSGNLTAEIVAVRAYAGHHKDEAKAIAAALKDAAVVVEAAPAPEAAPVAAKAARKGKKALVAADHTTSLYGDFSDAFDYFNAALFQGRLRKVLITLKAKPRSFGHYAAGRFHKIGDLDTRVDEIAMNPVHFASRSTMDTLSTLVHEMVHLEQAQFGKPGKGSHHNGEWAQMMKRQGLHPSSTGAPGGKETGNKVSHYILPGEAFEFACEHLLSTGFTFSLSDAGEYDRSKSTNKKQGKRVKYICPTCGQAAWAKHGAKLICGEDNTPMLPEDQIGGEEEGGEDDEG